MARIIIYDDFNMTYITGNLRQYEIEQIPVYCEKSLNGSTTKIPVCKTFNGKIDYCDESETIKLDETLMKRIAKYNKEAEIAKYDGIIKEKKEKIKELDDILQDKEKRVDKIKEFVANIYDLDVSDDDEYDYYEDNYDI